MFPMYGFGINLNSMMSTLPQTPEFQNGSAFGFNGYNMNPAFNQKNIQQAMIYTGPSVDVYGRRQLKRKNTGACFLGVTTAIIAAGLTIASMMSLFTGKK